jgi:transposase
VRYSGLDITVHQSDRRRAPGNLSCPGPPRVALGALRGRPGRAAARLANRYYYQQGADRLGANRACLAIARKLLKRSYHTLAELGEEALTPA